jgi:hypothetical protein
MKWSGVCSNYKKYKYYKFLKEKLLTNVKTRRGPYVDPDLFLHFNHLVSRDTVV